MHHLCTHTQLGYCTRIRAAVYGNVSAQHTVTVLNVSATPLAWTFRKMHPNCIVDAYVPRLLELSMQQTHTLGSAHAQRLHSVAVTSIGDSKAATSHTGQA